MIFHIWFKPHAIKQDDSKAGRFVIVDVAHENLESLCAEIDKGTLIRGDIVHSRFVGENLRAIHRRETTAFSGQAVDRVQPSHWNYVEDEA